MYRTAVPSRQIVVCWSVKFTLRWHLRIQESLYAVSTVSEDSPALPVNTCTDTSHWRWHEPLVLSTKIAQRYVFLRLSPPGDRWCDAPGVVSARSASVSSTLQIFRDRSHMWWLLFFRTVDSAMPWTAHPQNSSEAEQDHSGLFIPLSTVYLFIFRIESVRTLACMVWLLPLEVIHRFLRRAQYHLNTLYTKQKRQLPKNKQQQKQTKTNKKRNKNKQKQIQFYGLLLRFITCVYSIDNLCQKTNNSNWLHAVDICC